MAAQTPPEIEIVVQQVRAELVRMYEAGEIGKIECDCGEDRWVVRSLPIRRYEAVRSERRKPKAIAIIR